MSMSLEIGDNTELSTVVIEKIVVLNSLLFDIQIWQYLDQENKLVTRRAMEMLVEKSLYWKKPWDIFLQKHTIGAAQCKLRFASRFIRPFPKDMK